MHYFMCLLRSEEGGTVIEYALIAALISTASILAMTDLGQELGTTFDGVKQGLSNGNSR